MKSDDHADITAATGGVWRLTADGLMALERWDIGPATALVPTEAVLVLAVDLPLAGRAQRVAALPFAIEDRIADGLDAVHIALGSEIAAPAYLAGVVRHEVMLGWIATLDTAGLGHAAIVPDALLLPIPLPGTWNVEGVDGRVVVRIETGGGFAVSAERFLAVWTSGGSPPCTVFGQPLPLELPMVTFSDAAGATSRRLISPGLDLRQGRYAAAARPLPAALRRLGILICAGLVAHTAIAAADTIKLRGIAAQRRATAEALVEQVLPGTRLTPDLDRLLPNSAGQGRFLPLLIRASTVLVPVGGLTLTRLNYADTDGALTLGVEAADIGALQRAQAALSTAGLGPVSGAATAASGRADGDIVIHGAPL